MYPRTLTLTLAVLSLGVASANAAPEPTSPSRSLLPLEARHLGQQADPDRLEAVADQINHQGSTDGAFYFGQTWVESSFLDGLVDDQGQVTLPMGMRVFSTMGDTTLGFQSDL